MLFRAAPKLFQPPAGHAPGLVDPPDDEDQLLLADPSLFMHQPPEDSELFEQEIEIFEQRHLLRTRTVDGADAEQQGVEGQIIEPLTEGEAVAFGDRGRALERPAREFGKMGVERRAG